MSNTTIETGRDNSLFWNEWYGRKISDQEYEDLKLNILKLTESNNKFIDTAKN
jgi:hypothetical protein